MTCERSVNNLNQSDIICILVSDYFIASDYCFSKELAMALDRHNNNEAYLVPVIIRPTSGWHSLEFGKIKAVPKDGKAINEWNNPDSAWKDVTDEIRRLANVIQINK